MTVPDDSSRLPPLGTQIGTRGRHQDLIEKAYLQALAATPTQVLAGSGGDSTLAGKGLAVRAAPRLEIPGYRLVREIHRGAQGVVHEAVQQSTSRTVAVKVMRAGALAGPADRARFEREVQVLAQLKHPNIVTIHDSGRAADCDYIVMDYIEGLPLDRFVQKKQMPLRDRLQLFAKIGQAVNMAHLRGVIHRDLKPGNILVVADDRTGLRTEDSGQSKRQVGTTTHSVLSTQSSALSSAEPHILDFGLAKMVQEPGSDVAAEALTATGQFVGSLPWASPEQAEGKLDQIDLRTDVYALGVMLYFLLTEQFPYRVSASLRETSHNIVHAEPRDPRELNPHLDADITTIVLKCLRKPRDERYDTAGELARDVERYLRGEPIEARRESMTYVLRKHLARHKFTAGAVVLFVALITAGLATSLSFWRRAAAARDAEQSQRRVAEEHAERARLEAEKAEAINRFLVDMVGAADPEKSKGPKTTMEEMLDAAAAKLDKGSLKDQPLVEADARGTLGRTFLRLGVQDRAAPQLEQALALRRAHSAAPPDLSSSLTDLGMLSERKGDYEAAERYYRESLATLEGWPGRKDADLAGALSNVGLALRAKGKNSEALVLFERSLDLSRKVDPSDPELAVTLNNLALALRTAGQRDRAESCWREALGILRAAYGNDNLRVAAVLESLGGIYLDRGDFESAQSHQREANDIRRRVLSGDHPHVALGLNNLAHILTQKGDYKAAEALHREALQMRKTLHGDNHPYVASSLNNLGQVLAKMGDYPGAEKAYREALAIRQQRLGADHPGTLLQEANLAAVVRRSGRAEEAEAISRSAVERSTRAHPNGHEHAPHVRGEWGLCLSALGRFDEAERQLLAAYEEAMREKQQDLPLVKDLARDLASVYQAAGKTAEAEQWRQRSAAAAKPQ